jgi:hypothetical protein
MYSVLTKPEYAFFPDVRLVLKKLGLHLILDDMECIDTLFIDCLDASPSFSMRTMRLRLHVRLPRHRHPTTTSTTATSRTATSTKGAPPNPHLSRAPHQHPR